MNTLSFFLYIPEFFPLYSTKPTSLRQQYRQVLLTFPPMETPQIMRRPTRRIQITIILPHTIPQTTQSMGNRGQDNCALILRSRTPTIIHDAPPINSQPLNARHLFPQITQKWSRTISELHPPIHLTRMILIPSPTHHPLKLPRHIPYIHFTRRYKGLLLFLRHIRIRCPSVNIQARMPVPPKVFLLQFRCLFLLRCIRIPQKLQRPTPI